MDFLQARNRTRVQKTIDFLKAMEPTSTDGKDESPVVLRTWPGGVNFTVTSHPGLCAAKPLLSCYDGLWGLGVARSRQVYIELLWKHCLFSIVLRYNE